MSVAAFLANFSAQVRRARHPADRGLGGGPAGLQIRNTWNSYSAQNLGQILRKLKVKVIKFVVNFVKRVKANNWPTIGQHLAKILQELIT